MVVFCCREDNDLYRVLLDAGYAYPRYEDPGEALEEAKDGDALLILADDYPTQSININDSLLETVRLKSLRAYIEYPASFPGLDIGEPRPAQWERVVVSSDFFEPELEKGSILALHGCWYLPLKANSPHMVIARVAGYRKAIYGLPEDAFPILFQVPEHEVLVATSKLSQFVKGRYAPTQAWKAIWTHLLRWLTRSSNLPELSWVPPVRPHAGRDDDLPDTIEVDTLRRSVRWFRENIICSVGGKKGAIEGFESHIDHEGQQLRRMWVRADCIAETGMVFAYDWALTRNPASKQLACELLDYVWLSQDYYQDDSQSPVYGLVNWYVQGPVFYGDDNARVILSTLAAGRLLDEDRWDERVLKCILANLRTTGPLGFRKRRLDFPGSFAEGRDWKYYHDNEVIDYSPHYQAYLWATNLLAYALTGYEGFLGITKNAIKMTVDAYPNWRWTNGITQEIARMLLPLSFLVRVEDTPEHRAWLSLIAGELLAQMQPCGAIREKMGPIESGDYPSPRSNEAYGSTEAPLIQENGDPACDLLYTTNYAFLGLHEAAAATGDTGLKKAEDRLADFLCRIQMRSTAHPYLDGAWMRSFDYELWECWGSSADAGWGAWCVESGWTNSWISATLAMRALRATLFDLKTSERLRRRFPAILEEMEKQGPVC